MAIPLLKHDYIKKSAQAEPYTALAHLRYITRKQATHYFGSNWTTNYHAIQRLLTERENRIRKDGRVIDKFIIAVPKEMTMEQGIATLHRFGGELTRNRARYLFSIQDWNTENPHCHFVLIDEDIETGRRVVKTSELGSTHRIKRLWQDVGNSELEALGIEARIDFDAAEQKAFEQRNGIEPDNDNTPAPADEAERYAPLEEIEEPAVEEDPVVDETDAEDAGDGDDEMAAEPYIAYGNKPIENTLQAHRELKRLRHIQAQLKETQTQYLSAAQKAQEALEDLGFARHIETMAEQDFFVADAHLAAHTNARGKLKGFRLAIGGFELWKSRRRAEAEQAALKLAKARSEVERRQAGTREHEFAHELAEAMVADLKRREADLSASLALYGEGEDLQKAERLFKATIRVNMKKLDLAEAQSLYENGELNRADYREILEIAGERAAVEALDQAEADRSEGR